MAKKTATKSVRKAPAKKGAVTKEKSPAKKAIKAAKAARAEKPKAIKAEPAKKSLRSTENAATTASNRVEASVVDTSTPENKKKWRELREKFAKERAHVYSMSAQFEANQPIEHKVLGWGYILANNNDRLEVLFESGLKMLISNYKS